MFVGKTVNDAIRFIKTVSDDIHVLCVTAVVTAEDGLGYVVGNLDQA